MTARPLTLSSFATSCSPCCSRLRANDNSETPSTDVGHVEEGLS
jgi:hypothetical protein